MQKIKKYLAISSLLIALPISTVIASLFVLESSKEIYNYIPAESDLVIEINMRNFIAAGAYQRIFNEAYFNEKIVLEDDEKLVPETGLDIFSSVILFREQWSEQNIWMAIFGVEDRTIFETYLKEELPNIHYCFNDSYVIVQVTPHTENQETLNAHMASIMAGEIKSFKERVNLADLFVDTKEINCYIIPQSSDENNQLISGNLSFDFLNDKIAIDGEFTPVSGFSENQPVAYALDENAAFSVRSSLNLFSSIYWFSDDRIQNIPKYSQMALDYNGMNLFMVHKKLGYSVPFKQFPDLQVHFDIIEPKSWHTFFDTLTNKKTINVDTVTKILITKMGTFFIYEFTDKVFELMRREVNLAPCEDENLYFALQLKVAPLLDNIKFAVDEQNPPSTLEQSLGLMVAEGMVDELRIMANIDFLNFELRLEDETNMMANGTVQMLNGKGNSVVESIAIGKAAIGFITSYLSGEVGE